MIQIKQFNEYLQAIPKRTIVHTPPSSLQPLQSTITKKSVDDNVIPETHTYNNTTVKQHTITESKEAVTTIPQQSITTHYAEELHIINQQLQQIIELLHKNDEQYITLQTNIATQIALLEEKLQTLQQTQTTDNTTQQTHTKKKITINRDEFGRIIDAYIENEE